ncbi:MAG: hypothetical protein GY905_15555 [Gammaproteobacteria bacterium]|nr:hypothetical protein [Gammaproteobacteria bacterium]
MSFTPTIKASRLGGVSPCTVIFSCDGYAIAGYDEHDTWHKFGYSWDFDDDKDEHFITGRVARTGTGIGSTDKNKSVDGPMAMHTFVVADGGGSVEFEVLVNVKAPDGQIGQGSVTITVQAVDDYYSVPGTDIIACSNTLNILDDWSVYDRAVPPGATQIATLPDWDSMDGKLVMLFNEDVFGGTADDYFNIKLGTQNLVITYFGNHETGEVVTESGSTISFTAPDQINDSANGLGGFTAGNDVVITGTSDNNYRLRIRSVTAGQIITYVNPMPIHTELASGSAVLTEHHKRPDVGRITINTIDDGDPGSSTPDQAEFDVVGKWCENITFDSLRVVTFRRGVSYQHVGHHNCNLDRSDDPPNLAVDQGTGQDDFGWRTSHPWDGTIDPADVPIPVGSYISEAVLNGNPDGQIVNTEVGSTISFEAPDKINDSAGGFADFIVNRDVTIEGSSLNELPPSGGGERVISFTANQLVINTSDIVDEAASGGVVVTEYVEGGGWNIKGLTKFMPWLGIIGSSMKKSAGHNARISSWYRCALISNNLLGECTQGFPGMEGGGKHLVTFRSRGYGDYGDQAAGLTGAVIDPVNIEDYEYAPLSRFAFVHDTYAFAGETGNTAWLFQVGGDPLPVILLQDAIISSAYFEDDGVLDSGSNVAMWGQWMTSRGHRYSVSPQAGSTSNQDTRGAYCTEKDPILGIGSCSPFYTDPAQPDLPESPERNPTMGADITFEDTSFSLPTAGPAVPSAITQANPGVVETAADHLFTTGDPIAFAGIGGMTELNGNVYTITVLTSDTFDIGVDTTAFTSFTTGGTASPTVDVTIPGFGTPSAIMFLMSGSSVANTARGDSVIGWGFSDGTDQAVIGAQTGDGEAASYGGRTTAADRVISIPKNNGTSETVAFALHSVITDGYRLVTSVKLSAANTFICTATLIKGTDVANVHVGITQLGTDVGGEVQIDTVGFEPDVVFMGCTGSDYVDPRTNLIFSMGVGINDGLDTQRVTAMGSKWAENPAKQCGYIGNDVICGQWWDDVLDWDSFIENYDADGFSITGTGDGVEGHPDLDIIVYLCLKFTNSPDLALFDMEWPTVGNYTETTPGFLPSFGLICSMGGVASRDVIETTTSAAFSVAVFDGTTINTINATNEDGVTPAVAKSLHADTLHILNPDGVTDDVVASGYTLESDGWNFPLTTNPASNPVLGWGLAIGAGGSGGAVASGGGLIRDLAQDLTQDLTQNLAR